MIKNIIFDFDGVLVESVNIKTIAFAKLFESEGDAVVKKVVDYHLKNGGVSRFEKFRHIYNNFLKRELSDHVFEELCRRFSIMVAEEVIAAPFVAGAKEFLDAAIGAYTLFLLTGTPQDEIEDIINKRGMAKYFAHIYGSPKEKKVVVKEIVALTGNEPADILYVGDALSDYEAAKSGNVHFVARINNNESLFRGLGCIETKDMRSLGSIIGAIDKG